MVDRCIVMFRQLTAHTVGNKNKLYPIYSENCEVQTASHHYMLLKLRAALHAQCTCQRVETTKSEVELANPHFCTLASLIVTSIV
jgi:hypothetical protein